MKVLTQKEHQFILDHMDRITDIAAGSIAGAKVVGQKLTDPEAFLATVSLAYLTGYQDAKKEEE
jgi:hypothetical protein